MDELWKVYNQDWADGSSRSVTSVRISRHRIAEVLARLDIADHGRNLLDSLLYDLLKGLILVPVLAMAGLAIKLG